MYKSLAYEGQKWEEKNENKEAEWKPFLIDLGKLGMLGRILELSGGNCCDLKMN